MSNFPEIAEEEFHFLVQEYGFSVAERTDRYVRFEKNGIFVQCTYDFGRSFEVSMQVGKLNENRRKEETFFFETICRMYGISDEINYTAMNFRSADDVRGILKKISEISRRNMGLIFNCDMGEFEKLERHQDFECEEYAKSRKRVREFRLQAEAAWKRKKYEKMLQIYSQIQGELDEIEVERIEYAKDNIDFYNKSSKNIFFWRNISRLIGDKWARWLSSVWRW